MKNVININTLLDDKEEANPIILIKILIKVILI